MKILSHDSRDAFQSIIQSDSGATRCPIGINYGRGERKVTEKESGLNRNSAFVSS
jgi:hypothetical protein